MVRCIALRCLERRRAELAMARADWPSALKSLKATGRFCDSLRFQSLIGQLVGVVTPHRCYQAICCLHARPTGGSYRQALRDSDEFSPLSLAGGMGNVAELLYISGKSENANPDKRSPATTSPQRAL